MRKKIHSNLKEEAKTKKIKVKTNDLKSRVKGQKIRPCELRDAKVIEQKNSLGWKDKFTKKNITYLVLGLLDIILIIYVARKNVVNYVSISSQNIFVSKTKNLLVGRNYITLLITGFFYVYICAINRFFLKEKNTKKFLIWLFVILIILNFVLFFLFTKRVY